MKVVLMHGKDTDPRKKWYPWLGEEMKERGIEYIAPTLPKPGHPVLQEWLQELEKTEPDENTVLIGHSRGGVAILRYLEQMKEGERVAKVILVAANAGSKSKMAISSESNYGFYTEDGYDFEEIKRHCDNFVVLHSKDDPWVPFEAGVENAKGLDATFLAFEDRQHFGRGTDDIPELLKELI